MSGKENNRKPRLSCSTPTAVLTQLRPFRKRIVLRPRFLFGNPFSALQSGIEYHGGELQLARGVRASSSNGGGLLNLNPLKHRSELPPTACASRRAYGFRTPNALIALAMLSLGGLCPLLPL
ncbi:MAG: hypothetical protein M3065_05470 [Actinomycetota bacterium]|nr:hypothetical protein [Actinomycetota bacterium]